MKLTAKNLYLRTLSAKDCDYYMWLNDQVVSRYNSHGEVVYTKKMCEEYVDAVNKDETHHLFGVFDAKNDAHIGNISLQQIEQKTKSAQYAVMFGNVDYWGKGYAKEASMRLLKYGFEELKLNRIWLGTSAKNTPMQGLAKAMGMQKEATKKQAFAKNGELLDLYEYALLKSEYKALHVDPKTSKTKKSEYGKGLYEEYLQYCARCCMPSSNEGMQFDEMGICLACRAQEEKMRIDWKQKEKTLRGILDEYKGKSGDNYDCIIPISGGKDSVFQLHVLTKVYGMKPLAVTFNHNWYGEIGKFNLENALEKLGVDHIMFTPNKPLVKKLFKKSLSKIGDACWHCHAGVGAFPLQIAVKYNIPLVIWGESACEVSGRANFTDQVIKFDRDYFTRISAKLYPQQMIDDEISAKDLFPFELPSHEEIEKIGLVGLHLGDYLWWDDERQMEYIRDTYGWKEWRRAGHYKGFKGNECRFETLHDHMKFVKRGFGRGTDQASSDVRAGLLSRSEGFEVAKKYDQQRPQALDEYLQMCGIDEAQYNEILKSMREGEFKNAD